METEMGVAKCASVLGLGFENARAGWKGFADIGGRLCGAELHELAVDLGIFLKVAASEDDQAAPVAVRR